MKINDKVTITNRGWGGFFYGRRGVIKQIFDDGSFKVSVPDNDSWAEDMNCWVGIIHTVTCYPKDVRVGL